MGIPILSSDIQQSDLYKIRYTINEPSITFTAIKFSPNGQNFACSSSNGKIYIYNTTTGKLITTLSGHTKGISDIVYSPINSNILASCSDDLTIRLWNITQQRCIKILRKHTYHITTLKFTQKGNILISGSSDETITIWDITSNGGKILTTLAAHSDPVLSIALTPDDSIIVSASYDGLMRLFDLQTSQCLKTLTNSTFGGHGTATASTNDVINFPIAKVELSPNGQFILNSSLDGKIRLWNYMENKVYKTYQGINSEKICEKFNCDIKFITRNVNSNAITITSNNNDDEQYNNVLIVSGSDSTGLLIWDIQLKQIVFQVDPQTCGKDAILGVDTYKQGEILGCCSRDGIITILDMNKKYTERNDSVQQQKEVIDTESRGETPI